MIMFSLLADTCVIKLRRDFLDSKINAEITDGITLLTKSAK